MVKKKITRKHTRTGKAGTVESQKTTTKSTKELSSKSSQLLKKSQLERKDDPRGKISATKTDDVGVIVPTQPQQKAKDEIVASGEKLPYDRNEALNLPTPDPAYFETHEFPTLIPRTLDELKGKLDPKNLALAGLEAAGGAGIIDAIGAGAGAIATSLKAAKVSKGAKLMQAWLKRDPLLSPAYHSYLSSSRSLAFTGTTRATVTSAAKKLTSSSPKVIRTLLKKNVGKLAAADGLMAWMASDNIMSGASIFSRDLAESVRFGSVDSEYALELLDESDEIIGASKSFLQISTMVNPALWLFGKQIMANVEGVELARAEHRRQIEMGAIASESNRDPQPQNTDEL